MTILNPGVILPIYEMKENQMRYRCGCEHISWALPIALGEFVSVQFPVTPGQLGWTVTVHDENDALVLTLLISPALKTTQDGQRAWILLNWNNSALSVLSCGRYYLKFTSARYVRYSELFQVVDMTKRKKAWKLEFWNSTDIDGVLYQTGWKQVVWFLDGILDTPQIVEPVQNITDGDSVEVVVFQSVQRREVLRFPNFPDFWQGTLHRVRMHDNITLTEIATGQEVDLSGKGVQFVTDEQDICFQSGALSWIASTQVTGSCNENYLIV